MSHGAALARLRQALIPMLMKGAGGVGRAVRKLVSVNTQLNKGMIAL
jgi:hypothetical protein